MSTPTVEQLKHIIVIGAGVVGLTAAVKIQERGYKVTVIAEILPTDSKNIKYTSHWAGAHHVSVAGNDSRQQRLDEETFKTMWELSGPGSAADQCFLRIPQYEYFCNEISKPHPLEMMPDFKYLSHSSLIPGAVSGIFFTTITIDPPIYLTYLLSRFVANGGSTVRGSVQHVNQVIEGGFSDTGTSPVIDAVVVCTGLGSRMLGGVEDKDVYPIRGQTVLVRAPWIKFGMKMEIKDGHWTYIIPRRSGDVIIGGTKTDDDWYPKARPETTLHILKHAFSLFPELVSPDIRAERKPKFEDVLPTVIEEGCGLRPGRKGGVRLELQWSETAGGDGQAKKVPVIFNYGHGGFGFQSSWGSASTVLELLEGAFATL